MDSIQEETPKPSSLDELLPRFDQGDFDLVALGRALLVDDEWAKKVADERLSELDGFSKDALANLS